MKIFFDHEKLQVYQEALNRNGSRTGFQPVLPCLSALISRGQRQRYFLAGTIRTGPGGTANLAVLGGNLPPSFGERDARTRWDSPGALQAAGGSPAATGQWPVPPRPVSHRSGFAESQD